MFNEEDMDIVDDLLNITYEVADIYQELYLLECNNKGQSKEYQDKIKELKIKLDEEDSIYQEIYQDGKTYIAFIFMLGSEINDLEFSNYINDEKYVKFRIFLKLMLMSASEINNHELNENVNDIYIDSLVGLEVYKKYILISNYLLKEVKGINKEAILFKKYHDTFEHDLNENYFLNNNFDSSNLKLSDEYKKLSFEEKAKVLLRDGSSMIKRILNYSDKDLEDVNNCSNILKQYLNLRSLMLLMDEDMIKGLKDFYNDYITSDNYVKKHRNNFQIISSLNNLFEESKKDKTRFRI